MWSFYCCMTFLFTYKAYYLLTTKQQNVYSMTVWLTLTLMHSRNRQSWCIIATSTPVYPCIEHNEYIDITLITATETPGIPITAIETPGIPITATKTPRTQITATETPEILINLTETSRRDLINMGNGKSVEDSEVVEIPITGRLICATFSCTFDKKSNFFPFYLW